MIREQKRKLEQQRCEIEAADLHHNDSNDANSRDSTTSGTSQGKSTAATTEGGSRSRGGSVSGRSDLNSNSNHKASTPQKLILPKTLDKANQGSVSCPTTPQGSSSNKNSVSSAATAVNNTNSTAQQILVFSPQAQTTPLNQLLILSPLNQKGGAQQLHPTPGAIQTTQQVNIIPPTKERGVAQLQPVAAGSVPLAQPPLAASVGSPAGSLQQGSGKGPGMPAAGVVLTTTPQLTPSPGLATIPAVTAPTVFQFLSAGASPVSQPVTSGANITGAVSSAVTSVTSDVTTTTTSHGPVSGDAKSKQLKSTTTTTNARTLTSTQTTAAISAAAKAYSGPILTKENAHSLLSEQFTSRRSLLFDKSAVANSPSSNSSDSDSSGGRKKPDPTATVPVAKQVHPAPQAPAASGVNDGKILNSPGVSFSVRSPLACSDREKQLQLSKMGSGNRLVSKTVSSLLKEQRGHSGSHGDPTAAYVNDRRPVAELLRESRQRQQQQQQQQQMLSHQTLSPSAVMVAVTNPITTTSTVVSSGSETANTNSIPNTIYLTKNSSGVVTSAKTNAAVGQHQGNPIHVINMPKSGSSDDIISPNVSLAPKRMRSGVSEASAPRKRFCSGDGHLDILQNPRGQLKVLKTEQSPDGNLKMKLLSHPRPSDFSGSSNKKQNGRHGGTKAQPTATVTNSIGGRSQRPKVERTREVSICSDKDGFDYVGSEPDVDLADINPSITQMMGGNGQELKAKASSAQSKDVSLRTTASLAVVKRGSQAVNSAAKEGLSVSLAHQILAETQQKNQAVTLHQLLGANLNAQNPQVTKQLLKIFARRQTQGEAVPASALATGQQMQLSQQQQPQQQQQTAAPQGQQQPQADLSFMSGQDGGLNLQETSDQISTDGTSELQCKNQLSQMADMWDGMSSETAGMPELKEDVLLSQAADTFQGRLLRSRSLSGPAQRKPPAGGSTVMEELERQRSMSVMGFTNNANSNVNLLDTLRQVVAASNSVPQSPLCSTSMQPQPQQSPGMGPGSMPNSRRSSFVGSVSSSPVGMMSPGGPNSAHCSATSTPISAYSRSLGPSPVEPSNSFMPIQNSYRDAAASVNLVRPMVTVASALAQQANLSNPQMAQAPLLQGMREGSGFVPYPLGANSSKEMQQLDNVLSQEELLDLSQNNQFNNGQSPAMLTALQNQQHQNGLGANPPPAYNIALQQQQQQQQQQTGMPSPRNLLQLSVQQRLAEEQQKMLAKAKEDGKFAPVSSIKPVKRGGKSSKPAASAKRQRHRSAAPAIGRHPPGSAPKNVLLQALLSGTNPPTIPSVNTSHHGTGKSTVQTHRLRFRF